ncbi:acyl-CoA dehydrogenase family protein [Streptomyces sp. NPDC047081]|uniref:acyl-CoA dehydrogenase family protein n=1 Tax=Streptomyces sp. NPDC047081 TaxID=3154706 RepID=UPI0033F70509
MTIADPKPASVTDVAASATAELLEAAREMRPRLAERAPWVEQNRRIPEDTLEELHSAGFFRYWIPRRWGGSGGPLIGQLRIAAELAKGCPSTAWVWTLIGDVTAFAATFLTPEGTDAIYSSSDRPMAAGVLTPSGTARKVDGGYRVSGAWGFASGSLHADWIMGGLVVVDDNDEPVNQGIGFMPVSDGEIKDTWQVVGMRGTGSNTFVVQDVFVPDKLVRMASEMQATAKALSEDEKDPIDRMPFAPLFSVGLCGPLLGAAQAILEKVSANAHKRGITYFDFEKQTDSAVVLERLGEAAVRIDSAWLLVERAAYELEEVTRGGELSFERRAWCRVAAGQAVDEVRIAVDSLMSIAGASSFAESSVLQQYWRDVMVGSRHAFLSTRPLYEVYGRAYCQVEPNITPYI